MKYYAVTDDINELYHYGVKGMKWGQHLFGDDLKPKSPGYKRAANKLRSISKAAKQSSRKDVETWSDRRYQKKLEKAIKRSELSKAKYGWDQVVNDIKAKEREFKMAQKNARAIQRDHQIQQKYNARVLNSQLKQERKAAKAEKKFDRYLQDAREGHLRAGNLSNEQIQRINERLNAERATRQLGGSEKMSYRARKKEAFREGKIEGIKRGTASGMEALAKGLVEMGIKNRIVKSANNRSEARRQRVRNKIVNKKSTRERRAEIRRDLKDEAYQEKLLDPEYYNKNVFSKFSSTKRAAERIDQKKKLSEQKKLDAEIYRDAYKQWIKPVKGENAKQYRERIENNANEMRDIMQSLTYKNPNDPRYRRKTIADDGERVGKKLRSKVNKTVNAAKTVKSFFETYPEYEAGIEPPKTKAVTTIPNKPKSTSKPIKKDGYVPTNVYSYPEAQELLKQLGRMPTEAEIKSVRRGRKKRSN